MPPPDDSPTVPTEDTTPSEAKPLRLDALPADMPLARAPARGDARPRAIAWFGFSAFWGHLRHLLASAIATDNVDSRQWMVPEEPQVLLDRAVARLRLRGAKPAPTLTEAMGGELWLDFVSDTGDDVTVSERVAEMVSAVYEVTDGDGTLVLPRGDVLFLGGDLAYPVATVREVTRRLVEPWNRVLSKAPPGPPRLLLAVPGNHDWYDGLDGFARLCQAPLPFEENLGVEALEPKPNAFPVLAWAEAFAKGEQVEKPKAMAIHGYFPVQRTSYFRLPLANGLDLFGVDRQLKQVDERQSAFFKREPRSRAKIVIVPDPARAWGEKTAHGEATLASIGIAPAEVPTLVLAGDIHHYERSEEGPSVHVVAGGGGAFLHGARVAGRATYEILAEFPGKRASRALLARLPRTLALGGSGWLVLVFFALMSVFPLVTAAAGNARSALPLAGIIGAVYTVCAVMLAGLRKHRPHRVIPFSVVTGFALAAVPLVLGAEVHTWLAGAPRMLGLVLSLALSTMACGYLFGVFLAVLAAVGVNHEQSWAALGVPGFKCFMRLRVRSTEGGSTVDAWVVGQVDPVRKSPLVLVDRFTFTTPESSPVD